MDIRQIHNNDGAYSLQKTKKYLSLTHIDEDLGPYNKNEEDNKNELKNKRIILKEATIQNLLHDNPLHLTSNTKCARRVAPPNPIVDFEEVRQRSFLESKDSPEYMRNYDREKLGDIDNYYKSKNQNLQVLSRFGSWITLPPGCKDRSQALEKLSHGTYETSLLAPQWMDIEHPNYNRQLAKKESPFILFQWNNKCRDNTRVTYLMEKNQQKAKPLYLCDSYDRYGSQQSQTEPSKGY